MCVACKNTVQRVADETQVPIAHVAKIYVEASDIDKFREDDTPGQTVRRIADKLGYPFHMVGFVYLAILEDVRRTDREEEKAAAKDLLVALGLPVASGADVTVSTIGIPSASTGPEMN